MTNVAHFPSAVQELYESAGPGLVAQAREAVAEGRDLSEVVGCIIRSPAASLLGGKILSALVSHERMLLEFTKLLRHTNARSAPLVEAFLRELRATRRGNSRLVIAVLAQDGFGFYSVDLEQRVSSALAAESAWSIIGGRRPN